MRKSILVKLLIVVIAVFSVSVTTAQTKKTKKRIVHKQKHVKPIVNAQAKLNLDTTITRVRIITSFGEMIVRLYNKTPMHRDNFIKLVKEHFYDSLLFHRVINTFMIQGGDPNSKNAEAGTFLGEGDVGYTIPAEFDSTLYHKRGALCAARTDNPEKASSGCQFYIVQGKTYSDGQLDMLTMKNHVWFSPAKRMTYKMLGGTPQLDMNYTIFGEVESGLEVIDKVATSPRDNNNRPLTDVRMRMELL